MTKEQALEKIERLKQKKKWHTTEECRCASDLKHIGAIKSIDDEIHQIIRECLHR